jgi:hypothetical protein
MTPRESRVIEAAKAIFDGALPTPYGGYAVDQAELGGLGIALDALARSEQQPPASDVCECGHGKGEHIKSTDGTLVCWHICLCPNYRPAKETP